MPDTETTTGMNEAMKRVEGFLPIIRRNVLDSWVSHYPGQRNGFNVQEISAALVMAAGQLTVQFCPEDQLGRALGVLSQHLAQAMANAVDPGEPIFPGNPSPEQSDTEDQQKLIPPH